jgi:hypothetical protein
MKLQCKNYTPEVLSDFCKALLRCLTSEPKPWGATSVASRDTITFLPARRTLTLEEFKYAFESWRQTPAIAVVAFLQIFHCNA